MTQAPRVESYIRRTIRYKLHHPRLVIRPYSLGERPGGPYR